MDWDSPITVEESENTVTVEQLSDILDSIQKEELKNLLAPLPSSSFSQQGMLSQYVLAKSYVHQTLAN